MPDELLSETLKIRTLANHQQLEKQLVFQLKNIHHIEDYINVLQWFYSFFAGLEQKIIHYIGKEQLPDISRRRKSGNLLLDLSALEGIIPAITPKNYLPEITNQAQAFGALYVMEGSTLGGQVICKMIEKQIGTEKGSSFFKGYGNQTMIMWTEFKSVLDAQPDKETIIKSADSTFLKFNAWLSRSITN